jgi:hypothetical protein
MADLEHPTHRLVAEDVAGLHEHGQRPVEVQVRSADRGRADLHDGVGRLLDVGFGNVLHPHILEALPGHRLHIAADDP